MTKIPDWRNCEAEMIKEACRHGEAQLGAQVQLATSADQRATVLAGIYGAAATGILGAMATGDVFKSNHILVVGASVAVLAFLVAAFLCIKAILPVSFWTPGNLPSEWYGDITNKTELHVAMGEQAAHFDAHIKANNEIMSRNANYFTSGALLGIFAPLVGLAAAGLTCLLG